MRVPQDATRLWKGLYLVATALRPFLCRLVVEGREHVPATGGVVLAANHPGGIDVVFLGYASPRQIHYMAKHELFQIHPLFAAFIRAAGAFPVRRGQKDREAIAYAVRLVQAGKVLGMFPEGTRDRGRGLLRGKPGTVRIAMEAGAPIVPTGIIGVPEWHRAWYRPGPRPQVTVRFGEPLFFPRDTEDPAIVQARTDQLMLAIARLLPPDQWGVYAERLQGALARP